MYHFLGSSPMLRDLASPQSQLQLSFLLWIRYVWTSNHMLMFNPLASSNQTHVTCLPLLSSVGTTPWTLHSDETVMPLKSSTSQLLLSDYSLPSFPLGQTLIFAPWQHWGHSPSNPTLSPFNLSFLPSHTDLLTNWHQHTEPGLRVV